MLKLAQVFDEYVVLEVLWIDRRVLVVEIHVGSVMAEIVYF